MLKRSHLLITSTLLALSAISFLHYQSLQKVKHHLLAFAEQNPDIKVNFTNLHLITHHIDAEIEYYHQPYRVSLRPAYLSPAIKITLFKGQKLLRQLSQNTQIIQSLSLDDNIESHYDPKQQNLKLQLNNLQAQTTFGPLSIETFRSTLHLGTSINIIHFSIDGLKNNDLSAPHLSYDTRQSTEKTLSINTQAQDLLISPALLSRLTSPFFQQPPNLSPLFPINYQTTLNIDHPLLKALQRQPFETQSPLKANLQTAVSTQASNTTLKLNTSLEPSDDTLMLSLSGQSTQRIKDAAKQQKLYDMLNQSLNINLPTPQDVTAQFSLSAPIALDGSIKSIEGQYQSKAPTGNTQLLLSLNHLPTPNQEFDYTLKLNGKRLQTSNLTNPIGSLRITTDDLAFIQSITKQDTLEKGTYTLSYEFFQAIN